MSLNSADCKAESFATKVYGGDQRDDILLGGSYFIEQIQILRDAWEDCQKVIILHLHLHSPSITATTTWNLQPSRQSPSPPKALLPAIEKLPASIDVQKLMTMNVAIDEFIHVKDHGAELQNKSRPRVLDPP
ncbi:hypothetical protein QVD17_15649 [Tagetes erecta]|uniref:Uncharacterized protein n=1 Tax=Tagetes erecta TaxID=13708 RepID=A0AAD8KQ25_TARER|nr:hypothetical protein QVD17_15649 [Tagetes erecta]